MATRLPRDAGLRKSTFRRYKIKYTCLSANAIFHRAALYAAVVLLPLCFIRCRSTYRPRTLREIYKWKCSFVELRAQLSEVLFIFIIRRRALKRGSRRYFIRVSTGIRAIFYLSAPSVLNLIIITVFTFSVFFFILFWQCKSNENMEIVFYTGKVTLVNILINNNIKFFNNFFSSNSFSIKLQATYLNSLLKVRRKMN